MMSGHSWISYKPDGGETTFGTWCNNPTGKVNGLFENPEAGRSADAMRMARLDDDQEKKLMDSISKYKNMGADAWRMGAPCSSFARDAWKNATGEDLNSNYGFISNPTTLKESIIKANGGTSNGYMNPPRNGSSTSPGSVGRSSGSSLNPLKSSL